MKNFKNDLSSRFFKKKTNMLPQAQQTPYRWHSPTGLKRPQGLQHQPWCMNKSQIQSKFEQLLCFHCVDIHLAQQTPRKIIKVSHLRVTEIVRIEILKIVPCDNEK